MNKTVEAIKNGQLVTTEELFEVVNMYDMTHLDLMSDGQAVLSMQVNKFEAYRNVFEFSQDCTADHNKYVIDKDEIISSDAEWNEKADALFITCQLKNKMELRMMILFPNTSFKETESDGFCETDVYDIQEFLDDVIHEKSEWYIIMVKITDAFGLDFKMHNPFRTYVNILDEDWKLHISDDSNTFEVPVTDDSVNLFYKKETDSSKEIIVKPYGQSFMEIKMLFFKKHEQA